MKCGKPNEDVATYCTSCGEKFADTNQSKPAATQPAVIRLQAEVKAGVHQHMLTDLYLTEASGGLVLVARRPSMLHDNYEIVDGGGAPAGFLTPKRHLTHSGLGLEDTSHNLQAVVYHSNIRSTMQTGGIMRASPPNCWIEDANGNKTASLVFTNWTAAFFAAGPSGARIFDGSLTIGAGLRQAISAMEHKTYSIDLYEKGFSLPTLLVAMVVVDHIDAG